MAKKIIFFNHHGESNTTTLYNLGWKLAEKGNKVLLVDADPQCNLTSLFLNDSFETYFTDEATKNHNIKGGVRVAFESSGHIITPIDCPVSDRNPTLYLLPGHPDLAAYEGALSFSQTSNHSYYAQQSLLGAFNNFINKTATKYGIDYVLIDLNPGLSAINQNLFVLSDYFIVPINPDPFSIMAINTLAQILPDWVDWVERKRHYLEDAVYPLPDSTPKLIGTLIHRFNIRNGKAPKSNGENIAEIKQLVDEKIFPLLGVKSMTLVRHEYAVAGIADKFCLAEIPDFRGLLSKANKLGIPVVALQDNEINEVGTVLEEMIKKRNEINNLFNDISNKVISICSYQNQTAFDQFKDHIKYVKE